MADRFDDLAALCSRAGTPCGSGLLGEILRLRVVICTVWDALDSDVQAVVKVAAAQQVIMDLSPVPGHPDGGSTT